MGRERLHQEVESAGWKVDGSFSEHLVIGNKGELCLIIPSWVEGSNEPVYELYDVKKDVSYWVRDIPSPENAAELLQEHGGPPEEEWGNPYSGVIPITGRKSTH